MGLSDTLNSVSGALAGADKPAAPPPAKPRFFRGEPIGLPEGADAQSAQPNGGNTRDTAYPTEFIHFGYVHPDYSNRYEGQAKDNVSWDASHETGLHGAMQRAALQREALLLAGFVSALQETLKQRQKGRGGQGGLGSLVGAAADILGGQGGKQTEPTPEDCNPFGQAIKSGADKVKGPKVAYKDMHQAGIDLCQARADYAQYLTKLLESPPKDQGPAGLLSGVSAISSALPGGLGSAVTIVQGIAFKPFDVYLGIFTRIANALEPKVMNACHQLSIDAIKQCFTPLFAPWYQAPPGAQDEGAPSLGTNTGVSPIDSTTHQVDSAYKDVRDFLADTQGPTSPSAGYLDQAFVMQGKPPQNKTEPAKPAKFLADLITTSFSQALGVPLPGFLETMISEICAIDAEFLLAMYKALLKRSPSQAIDVEELKVAARKRLLDKLVNLLTSQVSFLQQAREFAFAPEMNNQQVVNLSPGNFQDRGENFLNEQFGKYLNPALDFAMSDLWKELEGARSQASQQNSMTMEVYLGILPWMLALLFRDTFFPVWDLLVEQGMGFVNDKLGGVFRSMDAFRQSAQDGVDTARDALTKADKLSDAMKDVNVNTDPNSIENTRKKFSDAADAKADRKKVAGPPPAIASFPTPGRANQGEGAKITKSEYDEVQANEKWSGALVSRDAG